MPSAVPSTQLTRQSVDIDGVHAAYGNTTVLRGITLSIEPGEVISLLGPSGCGKTTLLRCIAGLHRPTEGAVTVGDRLMSGAGAWVAPEKRGIGMVFQDGALFPHLDVRRNVGFGLPKGQRDGARVDQMLELVGLDGLGDRMPSQLSGGQQQRVALARALAPAPGVLLLDEPFSSLDVALRLSLRVEVRSLLRDVGVTAVFVTHDQDEAFVMGDRVAVLREGVMEQLGTPSELYLTPASPWVGTFVGDANLLTGSASGATVHTGIGDLPLASPVDGDVQVLIRPENLSVTAGGPGVIQTIEYYGHDTRYGIAIGDVEVAVRETGEPRHGPGASVSVGHLGAPAMAWPAS